MIIAVLAGILADAPDQSILIEEDGTGLDKITRSSV